MRKITLIRCTAFAALLALLTSSQQPASFRFSLNGAPQTAKIDPASCVLMMKVFTLVAGTPKTDLMLEIYRDNFPTLPAAIPLDGTSANAKGFYYPQKMLPATDKPYYVSTGGTLTVTRFDPAARTLSGTFSFKAQKFDPKLLQSVPGDVVEITNRAFEGVSYRKF